ncbi:MAG: class I SAM-dependent methyltransferase, partial [Betaproteobacteria bacterium]
GIAELLTQIATPGTVEFLRHSNAVQRLLSPAEMGELFKVIAFTRDFDQPLRGFVSSDRSNRL